MHLDSPVLPPTAAHSERQLASAAATEAEAVVRNFREMGISLFLVVEADGHARVVAEPWVALTRADYAKRVRELVPFRHRLLTDKQFARDVFGYLHSDGRALQQLGHRNPLPCAAGLTAAEVA